MLAARAVGKTYSGVVALAGVSFDLDRGDAAAVTGPNGSGKSTLLRLLATLERPTSGAVLVDGKDPRREGAAARARLAYVGDRPGLYDDLTIAENVAFAARFRAPTGGAARRVADALAVVGLAGREGTRAGALSRGERQRVALARALAVDPAVLLLDEPLAALDPAAASAVAAELERRRAAGATILVASPQPDVGLRTTRVLRLVAGRLAEGP